MSFESAAPATDEFSILDLFGPDASQQAQILVQEAADRSMDEMAVVINAAKAHNSSLDSTSVEALLSQRTDFGPYHTIGHVKTSLPSALLRGQDVQEKVNLLINQNMIDQKTGRYKTGYRIMKPPYPVFPFSPDITQLGVHLNDEAYITGAATGASIGGVFGKLSPEALAEFVKTWGSTRVDIAAKESLLSQLAHQLTLAMAEGVDLANASIVINKQNPTTKRIESVTIHAGEDENDQLKSDEENYLEVMLRRGSVLRHE